MPRRGQQRLQESSQHRISIVELPSQYASASEVVLSDSRAGQAVGQVVGH